MATQPIDRQRAKAAIKRRATPRLIQRSNKVLVLEVDPFLARLRPDMARPWWDYPHWEGYYSARPRSE